VIEQEVKRELDPASFPEEMMHFVLPSVFPVQECIVEAWRSRYLFLPKKQGNRVENHAPAMKKTLVHFFATHLGRDKCLWSL
jgi:hypothetical protein